MTSIVLLTGKVRALGITEMQWLTSEETLDPISIP